MAGDSLDRLTADVVACRACPRLVAWREEVAIEKRAAFRDDAYWGRPVPGFGDPAARVLIVGLAPAAESPDGAVVVRRPDARRTPPRQPPRPTSTGPAPPPEVLLEAVVRTLRVGQIEHDEQRTRAALRPGPVLMATDPSVTLATLRDAVAGRQRVWIGYVDATGRVERRVVEPLSVDGGRVTAFDHGTEEVRTFSVHRVTGVATADEPA